MEQAHLSFIYSLIHVRCIYWGFFLGVGKGRVLKKWTLSKAIRQMISPFVKFQLSLIISIKHRIREKQKAKRSEPFPPDKWIITLSFVIEFNYLVYYRWIKTQDNHKILHIQWFLSLYVPDLLTRFTSKIADLASYANINEQWNGRRAGSKREERGFDKPQMDNYSLDN